MPPRRERHREHLLPQRLRVPDGGQNARALALADAQRGVASKRVRVEAKFVVVAGGAVETRDDAPVFPRERDGGAFQLRRK